MGSCGHLGIGFPPQYPSEDSGFDIREGMAGFIHA